MELLGLFTILRLLVPIVILRFSLLGILLSILVDLYDWTFLNITNSQDYELYQSWDKVMDFYMFALVFITSLQWKDKRARLISICLFGMRAIGNITFLVTGIQSILLFTPNIFEPFVLFYLFYVKFSGTKKLFTSWRLVALVMFILTVPKMIHEYLMHVLRVQPWELFSFGDALMTTGAVNDYIDYIGWGIIIHSVQLVLLVWLILSTKRREAK